MIHKQIRFHFDSIDSTNDYLLKNDFPHSTIVTASTQTKGKGRNQRSWYDVPNHSFLFSIVLKFNSFTYTFYPLLIGLCVVEAAKKIQKELSKEVCEFYIKWPNDILLKRNQVLGKLAGILIETQFKNDCWNVVIGIGLNWREIPVLKSDEFKFPPIALFDNKISYEPDVFIDYLIEQMNEFCVEHPKPFNVYLDFIHQYHFLYGKKIQILNETYIVDKINEEGFLKIIHLNTNHIKVLTEWEDHYAILINN